MIVRVRNRLFHLWFLIRRPMTLGVRAIAIDDEGRVLLVRHTYIPGWHIPGGGVDPGETTIDAVHRELAEEANIEALAPPELVSVHFNRLASRRDHVMLYRINVCRQTSDKMPDAEIAETGFFALDSLPSDLSPGTRRRLDEVFGDYEPDGYW